MKKQAVAVLIFVIVLVLTSAAPSSSSSKTQQKCNGPNEEFKCILPCGTTCLDLQFARCGGPCVEDCYCKNGYLRDEDDDGKCKLPKDCFINQKTGQIGLHQH